MDSGPNTTPQARPRGEIASRGGRGLTPSPSIDSGFRFHGEREYLLAKLRRADRRIDHLMARERTCHRKLESLEKSLEDAENYNTSLESRLRRAYEESEATTGNLRATKGKLALLQSQLHRHTMRIQITGGSPSRTRCGFTCYGKERNGPNGRQRCP